MRSLLVSHFLELVEHVGVVDYLVVLLAVEP